MIKFSIIRPINNCSIDCKTMKKMTLGLPMHEMLSILTPEMPQLHRHTSNLLVPTMLHPKPTRVGVYTNRHTSVNLHAVVRRDRQTLAFVASQGENLSGHQRGRVQAVRLGLARRVHHHVRGARLRARSRVRLREYARVAKAQAIHEHSLASSLHQLVARLSRRGSNGPLYSG